MDFFKSSKNANSREKALKDIGETKKVVKETAQSLKVKILSQPGLLCPTSDEFLLQYLRASKFNVNKAFEQILHYYKMKARHEEYFRVFTPSSVKHIYDAGITAVLPEPDNHNRTVMLWSPGNYHPEEHKFSPSDLDKASFLQMDYAAQQEQTQIFGLTAILNYQNMTWKHFQSFTPLYAQKVMPIYMHAFPIRPKAMHLVLAPAALAPLLSLTRSFMSKKMQQRIFLHTSLESLHAEVPKEILPEELGGKLSDMATLSQDWYKTLHAHEREFEEQNQFYFKESVATKAKDGAIDSQILGTAGTFCRLNID